jgi:hypothetical protein
MSGSIPSMASFGGPIFMGMFMFIPNINEGSIIIGSNSWPIDIFAHGSIMNLGLVLFSELSRAVLAKSSYPDMGVCDTNPLTGVGSGDRAVGSVDGMPFVGDWSKKEGDVVEIGMLSGFSSGVGRCMGCDTDGCRECTTEEGCDGVCG